MTKRKTEDAALENDSNLFDDFYKILSGHHFKLKEEEANALIKKIKSYDNLQQLLKKQSIMEIIKKAFNDLNKEIPEDGAMSFRVIKELDKFVKRNIFTADQITVLCSSISSFDLYRFVRRYRILRTTGLSNEEIYQRLMENKTFKDLEDLLQSVNILKAVLSLNEIQDLLKSAEQPNLYKIICDQLTYLRRSKFTVNNLKDIIKHPNGWTTLATLCAYIPELTIKMNLSPTQITFIAANPLGFQKIKDLLFYEPSWSSLGFNYNDMIKLVSITDQPDGMLTLSALNTYTDHLRTIGFFSYQIADAALQPQGYLKLLILAQSSLFKFLNQGLIYQLMTESDGWNVLDFIYTHSSIFENSMFNQFQLVHIARYHRREELVRFIPLWHDMGFNLKESLYVFMKVLDSPFSDITLERLYNSYEVFKKAGFSSEQLLYLAAQPLGYFRLNKLEVMFFDELAQGRSRQEIINQIIQLDEEDLLPLSNSQEILLSSPPNTEEEKPVGILTSPLFPITEEDNPLGIIPSLSFPHTEEDDTVGILTPPSSPRTKEDDTTSTSPASNEDDIFSDLAPIPSLASFKDIFWNAKSSALTDRSDQLLTNHSDPILCSSSNPFDR